jgi:hypothetical protein
MKRYKLVVFALCLSLLAACNPVHNWRELVWSRADIKAMFPCKPDLGSQKVELAGHPVDLQMAGCEVGDQLFAISCFDLKATDQLQATQQAWQRDMLTNLQAASPVISAVAIKGASLWPAPVRLRAAGRGTRGERLQAQAVWFAKAATLCHAVMYAPDIGQEAVETFFSGIEIQ